MLIVSQDRLSVINFESFDGLSIDSNEEKFFISLSVLSADYKRYKRIGEFKDEATCRKAIESFIKAYVKGDPAFYIPQDEQEL